MTRWASRPLEAVCSTVTSGGTPSRRHPEYFSESGIPWVKSQELLNSRIWDTEEHISVEGLRRSSAKMLPPDTVLLAMYGANVGQLGYLATEATVNQAICAFVADPLQMNSRFLFYALSHLRVDLVVRAHGAAQQNLSQQLIRPFHVPCPPIETQEAIAGILASIDDLIENNRRRVVLLEEMARELYREWFVRFRFPGHESATFVDSPLGPIPKGWTTPRLEELVSTQYGYTESASMEPVGPRYLRGMDINKRTFIDWSTVPYCPIDDANRSRYAIKRGDVFVIRMADPGKVGFCEDDIEAVFASYLVRLRPASESITPLYLFFTLSDTAYQDWVTGASTGATRKSVSARVMTEPRILLPDRGTQGRFEAAVGPMRQMLGSLVKASSLLAATRDLLLPKLVTGQIDVSCLDLDLGGVCA